MVPVVDKELVRVVAGSKQAEVSVRSIEAEDDGVLSHHWCGTTSKVSSRSLVSVKAMVTV